MSLAEITKQLKGAHFYPSGPAISFSDVRTNGDRVTVTISKNGDGVEVTSSSSVSSRMRFSKEIFPGNTPAREVVEYAKSLQSLPS
jgi:hypothetical protein